MAELSLYNRRFVVTLWTLGMLGAVTVVLLWPSVIVDGQALPAPSLLGNAIFIALAVTIGASLARDVGLQAPAVEAFTERRSITAPLRAQLVPGILGGALGALIAVALTYAAPADSPATFPYAPTLMTRVLGGGITEEILFRWGTMTLVLWLLWRTFQRNAEKPRSSFVWVAITISAVLFGAYHVPGVATLTGPLSPAMITYVVAGPTVFGFIAGFLFWRYGLEAAMISHAMTHVLHDMAYAL